MADILIRGMEMPNVGEKIEFTQNIAGRIYAKFNPSRGYMCEVIELPEHGDLIDRDAAIEESKKPTIFDLTDVSDFLHEQSIIIPSNKENKNANQN